MENFSFFALSYLNDWYEYDEGFCRGLRRGKERKVRLSCMREAAKYYRVNRNFKEISEEKDEERLSSALQALDEVDSVDQDVDSAVQGLAHKFKSAYGKNLVSAASKFLWIQHKSPVVIYDDNAFQWLKARCKMRLRQYDYPAYRQVWTNQFEQLEGCIRHACSELSRVKGFSLAYAAPDENFAGLVSGRWFHERVYDKFLWWNGARLGTGSSNSPV